MKKTYYLLLAMSVLATACRPQAPLSGIIHLPQDGEWKEQVYLLDPLTFDGVAASYRSKLLDSALIEADGSFVFQQMPTASAPRLLEIAVQKQGERYPNQLDNEAIPASNYFPLIWQDGAEIRLTADAGQFQQRLSIETPSPGNAALLRLRDIRWEAYQKWLSGQESGSHDEDGLLEAQKAVLEFQKPLMQFADSSTELLPALVAIRWISISGDYERIPEFVWQACEKWRAAEPDHPWVAQLCQHARRETLPVLQGDKLPNFSLPMLSGDTLALQQLLGERLTLLDLWASWCVPCRRENQQHLVPLWEKYREQGLQIIGYSIDAGSKAWQTAIEKDGAGRWLNASHLEGDDAPLFKTLRISTIPANFLLDAEGRVIAKNLHGAELAQFVEKYFEK